MPSARDPRSTTPGWLAAELDPASRRPDRDDNGPPTRKRADREESLGSGITTAETIAFIVALIAVVVLVALI
jgi:hypothetical protein